MDRKIIVSAQTASEVMKTTNGSAYMVYSTLLGHRNGRTGECYATQATIADETGLSDRSVRTALKLLKEGGFLDWKQGSSFSSKANSYIFPREIFDAEGKGEAIEEKKLKKKNKEQKIVQAKNQLENKLIPMITPRFINKIKVDLSKVPPAPLTLRNEVKDKTINRSNNIKLLIKDYINLVNEYNEMAEDGSQVITASYVDAIKHHADKNEEMALYLAKHAIEETKQMIIGKKSRLEKEAKHKEFKNRIENITLNEAIEVYNSWKGELTNTLTNTIENVWLVKQRENEKLPKTLVTIIKDNIEAKGLEFEFIRNKVA